MLVIVSELEINDELIILNLVNMILCIEINYATGIVIILFISDCSGWG